MSYLKIYSPLEISSNDLKGTGQLGKITKSDVLAISNEGRVSELRATSRKKMSTLRRKIADRLVSVKNETAMLTTFNEVDMSAIFQIRKQYKDKFKQKNDVGSDEGSLYKSYRAFRCYSF